MDRVYNALFICTGNSARSILAEALMNDAGKGRANAAGEVCPLWPGRPATAHWGLPDPAAVKGSEAEVRLALRDAAVTLKRRIDLMLALPLSTLDSIAIRRELRDIGSR